MGVEPRLPWNAYVAHSLATHGENESLDARVGALCNSMPRCTQTPLCFRNIVFPIVSSTVLFLQMCMSLGLVARCGGKWVGLVPMESHSVGSQMTQAEQSSLKPQGVRPLFSFLVTFTAPRANSCDLKI